MSYAISIELLELGYEMVKALVLKIGNFPIFGSVSMGLNYIRDGANESYSVLL